MLNPKEKTIVLFKIMTLHLIALFFVTLNIAPIKIPNLPSISPIFSAIVVFYFCVYRAEVFSFFFIFILGLWCDSLRMLPLGTTSFALLLSIKIIKEVNSRVLTKDTFSQLVILFSIFCFVFSIIKWSILSIFYQELFPIIHSVLEIGVTVLIYIILHNFLDFLNNKLVVNVD